MGRDKRDFWGFWTVPQYSTSATDPLVNSILLGSADNASYLSPSIQNELIHLMANQIRKQIAKKVNSFKYEFNLFDYKYFQYLLKVDGHVFALMADEAKDCSGHEQLSIVLRCISHEPWKNNDKIDRNSIFKEYLLGLVKMNEFDAESLSIEIIKYLSLFHIDINNCVAICFDGQKFFFLLISFSSFLQGVCDEWKACSYST